MSYDRGKLTLPENKYIAKIFICWIESLIQFYYPTDMGVKLMN